MPSVNRPFGGGGGASRWQAARRELAAREKANAKSDMKARKLDGRPTKAEFAKRMNVRAPAAPSNWRGYGGFGGTGNAGDQPRDEKGRWTR